ncbi:MAG: polyamine aminopropyltransferase [Oscillospiraceae bacterium]
MGIWYTENHTQNVRFSMKVSKQVYSGKSDFQLIEIFDTAEFGRVLTLDGFLMLTQKDEFIYHEMITHVAMATNLDKIKSVLVIGAGDGGTIRELCRYDSIKHIDMVEIDKQVVDVCKEYLPQTACKLTDNRLTLIIADGLKYVRTKQNEYDLIIVDSTDPFGPGEGLFTKEFYGNCFNALTENGILINQHESPYYQNDARAMQRAHRKLSSIFPVSYVYQVHIPTYPSGHWLFGYASKGINPIKDINEEKWNALNLKTGYYNTDLHKGCFALPNYVKELLEE